MTGAPDARSGGEADTARQEAVSLDRRLDRLEEILAGLERPDVELEDAMRLFEEGVRHLRAAEEVIRRVELRVERLLDDEEGARTEPLDGAQ